jgi:hypothetical protein
MGRDQAFLTLKEPSVDVQHLAQVFVHESSEASSLQQASSFSSPKIRNSPNYLQKLAL